MSIELKQAIDALSEARRYVVEAYEFAFPDQDANECVLRQIDEAITAIQQAEAKTGEPIYQICKADSVSIHSAWVDVDKQAYDDAGLYPEYGRRMLYTHSAPGVPEQDWERKERLQSIADTAAASGLFGLAQKWANNEIHSYQFTHQAAAIVLKAMLTAAQAQKGQP